MFVPLQSHSENIQKNPKESAEIAQLVEHNLAKVGVASSSLVFRSKRVSRNADLNYEITRRGTIIFRSSFTKVGFFLLWLALQKNFIPVLSGYRKVLIIYCHRFSVIRTYMGQVHKI